jgi:hypothetical protein
MHNPLLPYYKRKLLKFTNPDEYRNQKFIKTYLAQQETVNLNIPEKAAYSFKHSGNAGDIIYALPSIASLKKTADANFYLHLNQKAHYGKMKHPLGNVMLNEGIYKRLQPLLQQQHYITTLHEYNNEPIDYDFDFIRRYPFMHNAGSIARWYFYFFAHNANLGLPWLSVTPNNEFADSIVVARSFRYRQPLISYAFLKKYSKVVFVGLEDEYADMKTQIPHLVYAPVNDFLALAQIIAGSKLFIGNQSFPFSIAEGLKVKRILEVFIPCPNVVVEGTNGYDFIYQPQFEKLVSNLVQH